MQALLQPLNSLRRTQFQARGISDVSLAEAKNQLDRNNAVRHCYARQDQSHHPGNDAESALSQQPVDRLGGEVDQGDHCQSDCWMKDRL